MQDKEKMSSIDSRISKTKELNELLAQAKYPEKKIIISESRLNEMRAEKLKQEEKRKMMKAFHIDKLAVFATVAVLASGTFALAKNDYDWQHKPVTIVTNDMLATIYTYRDEDSAIVDPILFDKYNIDEIYNYIKENKIAKEDIYGTVREICKRDMRSYDTAIKALNEKYPNIFHTEYENIENKGKTK